MVKRSKDEEEEVSAQETGDEDSPPPQKKSKKSSEKKPAKKSKTKRKMDSDDEVPTSSNKKGNVAKNSFTNTEGEKYVDLGKKKRATVRNFKGMTLIDIREFWGEDDDLKPGKKGISLSVEQWNELKSNADTIDDLIRQFM